MFFFMLFLCGLALYTQRGNRPGLKAFNGNFLVAAFAYSIGPVFNSFKRFLDLGK
jgi:hypothetical protein